VYDVGKALVFVVIPAVPLLHAFKHGQRLCVSMCVCVPYAFIYLHTHTHSLTRTYRIVDTSCGKVAAKAP